ncbi:MAG: FkbM family methyltransferase [Verrucomicrobiales bacterium]
MKWLLEKPVLALANTLLSLLRNRRRVSFSRPEFRAVNFTFSQYAEDAVAWVYLRRYAASPGIYIDAGAFDPVRMSTTLLLHQAGWKGINIDLDPEKISRFQEARPGDHSVACALSDTKGSAKRFRYAEGAFNRITSGEDDSPHEKEVVDISETETTTLTAVIENSPFRDFQIDYLNVDCEGHDLRVLRGLDFARWRS